MSLVIYYSQKIFAERQVNYTTRRSKKSCFCLLLCACCHSSTNYRETLKVINIRVTTSWRSRKDRYLSLCCSWS